MSDCPSTYDKVAEQFQCDNKYRAVLAGAVAAVTGLDRLFVRLGAPRAVHWALAGFGTDVYCKGEIDYSRLALCGAGGFAGGMAIAVLRDVRL